MHLFCFTVDVILAFFDWHGISAVDVVHMGRIFFDAHLYTFFLSQLSTMTLY